MNLYGGTSRNLSFLLGFGATPRRIPKEEL